jgi:hypothetical protein
MSRFALEGITDNLNVAWMARRKALEWQAELSEKQRQFDADLKYRYSALSASKQRGERGGGGRSPGGTRKLGDGYNNVDAAMAKKEENAAWSRSMSAQRDAEQRASYDRMMSQSPTVSGPKASSASGGAGGASGASGGTGGAAGAGTSGPSR